MFRTCYSCIKNKEFFNLTCITRFNTIALQFKKKLQCHNFNIPERILIAGKRDTLILRLCRENVQYSVAKNYSLDYNLKKGQFKLLLQPNSDNAY